MGPDLSPEVKAEFTMEISPSKEKENGPDLKSEFNMEVSPSKEENGPNLSPEVKSEFAVEVLPAMEKQNGSVQEDHLDDNKLLSCASNYEDNTFDMEGLSEEHIIARNGSEDMEINVTDCTNSDDIEVVEAQYQNDETESSSSFGNTDDDDGGGSIMSDAEVDSQFHHGNMSDGRSEAFRVRKKKLTDHWRNYIRPLMWRCKWAELKMKEFQSQALKYDRELAKYDKRKQFELEKFNSEGLGAKSLPFPSEVRTNKIMKRKKRKRVEDTVDVASYMSHHNLFSYYENKSSVGECASRIDDCGNLGVVSASKITNDNDEFGFHDGWSSLEFRDNDNSLEEILWKIEKAKLQVNKLKTRMDKVVSENAGKYSSINKLMLVPCNASTSSARNPTSPSNGNRMPVGSLYAASQHVSDCNMGDLGMPETAASSHGEATPVPDIIESTEQHQTEEVLIHNQAAKEELNNFHGVKVDPTVKPLVPKEEQESTIPPVLASEVDPSANTLIPHVQSTEKSPSTSKVNVRTNKRKQGRRKAKSGRWKRRSTS
ncbi:hypothetical protein PVL29_019789 [Vitis rotundifolia]|uniref:Uncharacterized protein n=1 Tax=Vitis rotundifolia TaxID=103349 RepID=A0AA38Z249_VITRO|nr:hypothetical protein PVL29_019789 [Vitis rotundifolia]